MKKNLWKEVSFRRKTPLWKGPFEDGLTQSLIALFLRDPHRFYLKNILGLDVVDTFNPKIAYGHIWHKAAEIHNKGGNYKDGIKEMKKYLSEKYPTEVKTVEYWAKVCDMQFSIYTSCPFSKVTCLKSEMSFKYEIENGFILRGKIDAIVQQDNGNAILDYKTKGIIDIPRVIRQLKFDLQTMLYAFVASKMQAINSVIYHLIRRPLSGGKHSIVQYKPSAKNPKGESDEEFMNRLSKTIQENKDEFFYEIKQQVTKKDLERFCVQALYPITNRIIDWWEFMEEIDFGLSGGDIWSTRGLHYLTPFGVHDETYVDEEIDNYLMTGSTVGLRQIETLFPEL